MSDEEGRFVFGDLTPGTYRLRAQLAGFETLDHGPFGEEPIR